MALHLHFCLLAVYIDIDQPLTRISDIILQRWVSMAKGRIPATRPQVGVITAVCALGVCAVEDTQLRRTSRLWLIISPRSLLDFCLPQVEQGMYISRADILRFIFAPRNEILVALVHEHSANLAALLHLRNQPLSTGPGSRHSWTRVCMHSACALRKRRACYSKRRDCTSCMTNRLSSVKSISIFCTD
jgi:hypothetical protein